MFCLHSSLSKNAYCLFQEDLVRYPEQHETIFQNIKQRRDQCVRELADIERDIMNKVT